MLFWLTFIIVIFILLCLSTEGPVRYRSLYRWSAVIIIIAISIFRFDIGFDYSGYYQTLSPTLEIAKIERFEPINQLIFLWAHKVGFPPLVFIVTGLITYILVFYSLYHYSHNFTLAVLTYLAFFYTTSLGPIRQGAAIAVILYAYKFLISKKIIKYLICCVVAFLFHSSAIICVLFPLIYKYYNLKILIISSVLLFIAFAFIEHLIDAYLGYGIYLTHLNEMEGGNILKYFYLAFNIIFLIITRRQIKTTRYKLFYLTTFGALLPFVFGGHLGGRISWYFMCYLCIILPDYINSCGLSVRRMYALFVCSFFIVSIWITTHNPIKTPYTPYQTIFSIKDYDNPKFK